MTTPATLPAPPRRWVPRTQVADDEAAVDALVRSLRLPEPLCRLLVRRGHSAVHAAKAFLRPRLNQLGDPLRLAGMAAAVDRLEQALDSRETILIHGDYDVDGMCAAALYTRVLHALGGRVQPFVPHRLRDGYDLGKGGIRAAVKADATLILTGDCGTGAHEAVAEAAAAGIDVVITDHHTPGRSLPAAAAVVNPKRSEADTPERALCGTGVAFKVCQALVAARGADPGELWYDLDLVALATIADLVPLTGENRVLARYGLRVLHRTGKPGLRALLRTTGLQDRTQITAGQVGHVLAPRLNAAGRIGDAHWGLQLLATRSERQAAALAKRLEALNDERRRIDRDTLAQALSLLEREYDPARDFGVVLAAAGWHPGVIGIVASRVVERIHRPAVLIALAAGGGPCRGSARSVRSFHLHEALRGCAEHLVRFGGHRAAAGLDIRPERIDAFREAFNAQARAALAPDDLADRVEVDLDLGLREARGTLFRYLRHFGPFGVGNPAPVFAAHRVRLARTPRAVGDGHVKLDLAQDGVRLRAIGFRMADRVQADMRQGAIDIAFQLQEDRWNGRTRREARLVDVRPAVEDDQNRPPRGGRENRAAGRDAERA